MARRQTPEMWETEDGLLLIKGWARDGLSQDQIAHNMGVTLKTLYVWKKQSTKIGEALNTSKEVANRVVENSLFKRATGFEYTEITEERVLNPNTGQFEMVVTKKVNKVALPDVSAQIFWLKNRKPAEWQDRRVVESTEALEKLDSILGSMKETAIKQMGENNGPFAKAE